MPCVGNYFSLFYDYFICHTLKALVAEISTRDFHFRYPGLFRSSEGKRKNKKKQEVEAI